MLTTDEILRILSDMYPNIKGDLNYRNAFELLICVVLSAQTTDAAVNKITPFLYEKYPDPFSLANADFDDVKSIIKHIGLNSTKAKNIIALSKILVDKYYGNVPSDFDQLVSLPGVGRKTANVVLSEGFKIPRIAVDTHVFRVSNRLGLANSDNVLDVEKELMSKIDEKMWGIAHLRLLFFGRYFCKSKNPNCQECPFQEICTYYNKKHL